MAPRPILPVRDEDGEVRRVAGVPRDVTGRRNAQEALAEAKQKYQAVFDVNPVFLVVIDAEAGVLLEANRGFEELFGYSREAVEGRPLADLDIFLNPERIATVRGRAFVDGEVRDEVLHARRSDGEVREVLLSCARVDEEMYRAKRSDGQRWRIATLSPDRAAAGPHPAD